MEASLEHEDEVAAAQARVDALWKCLETATTELGKVAAANASWETLIYWDRETDNAVEVGGMNVTNLCSFFSFALASSTALSSLSSSSSRP